MQKEGARDGCLPGCTKIGQSGGRGIFFFFSSFSVFIGYDIQND